MRAASTTGRARRVTHTAIDSERYSHGHYCSKHALACTEPLCITTRRRAEQPLRARGRGRVLGGLGGAAVVCGGRARNGRRGTYQRARRRPRVAAGERFRRAPGLPRTRGTQNTIGVCIKKASPATENVTEANRVDVCATCRIRQLRLLVRTRRIAPQSIRHMPRQGSQLRCQHNHMLAMLQPMQQRLQPSRRPQHVIPRILHHPGLVH